MIGRPGGGCDSLHKMIEMNDRLTFLTAVFTAMLLSSCGGVKHAEMLMLQNVQNQVGPIDSLPVLRIQSDDILGVFVSSQVQEANASFQEGKEAESASSGEQALGVKDGYRVDEAGNIYIPYIGAVHAEGKTILDLREEISTKIKDYYPDATVQVRFLNFRITIMGEVLRPNVYTIPNERLNILEALGMAGDFTPYAKRNNVLIIRERNKVREINRINTQDPTLFQSPYFYLRPNDVVYVEPLKAKQYATQGDFFQRYSGIFFPVVSLITFIAGLSIK